MRDGARSADLDPQSLQTGGESPPRFSSDSWIDADGFRTRARLGSTDVGIGAPPDGAGGLLLGASISVICDGRSDDDEEEDGDEFYEADTDDDDLDEYDDDDDLYDDDLDDDDAEDDDD